MQNDSYIRGAAAPARIDPRRVGWGLAVAAVVVLFVCCVTLAATAASGDSSSSSLRMRGVTVPATVSGCTGITSGIGMGAEYYQCRGTYSLGGRSFDEVIHGSRGQLPAGSVVEAVVVPGDPASLSLPATVTPTSAGSYTAPVVLGSLATLGTVGLVLFRRRRSTSAPRAAG